MATKDQRFELPDGSVYIVTGPAADSDGEWVEMEWHPPADCLPPPPHIHPPQVEEYEVLEGSLDIVVNGERQTLGPGEKASVPQGTLHTLATITALEGTGSTTSPASSAKPAAAAPAPARPRSGDSSLSTGASSACASPKRASSDAQIATAATTNQRTQPWSQHSGRTANACATLRPPSPRLRPQNPECTNRRLLLMQLGD